MPDRRICETCRKSGARPARSPAHVGATWQSVMGHIEGGQKGRRTEEDERERNGKRKPPSRREEKRRAALYLWTEEEEEGKTKTASSSSAEDASDLGIFMKRAARPPFTQNSAYNVVQGYPYSQFHILNSRPWPVLQLYLA